MKMTAEGLALIKHFEGFRGKAYLCPAGVWTIGYGHTAKAGPPAVVPGMTLSEAEAHDVLVADVERFADDVRNALRQNISDRQFSALVSFAYNVGSGAFRSSSVLKAVNAGDFDAVPRRLQLWVKAAGKVLPGLVTRRAAEAELFLTEEDGPDREAVRTPEPVPGKPAWRSTTIISSLVMMLAGVLSAAAQSKASWAALALVVVSAGACAWIIRERLRKSREDGI